MSHPPATLAILAGGAGSRMGRPKSLLTVRDRPILEYLLQRFDWRAPTLLITTPGREEPPGHHLFSAEATDPTPDLGPLRGVLTALEACATPLLAVGTVDMPCLTAAHFKFLLAAIESRPNCLGVMLRRQDSGMERIEPFPSVFRIAARGLIAAELQAGRRPVHALCERESFITVEAPQDWPERTWTNLNHPEDLDRFPDGAD